MDELPNVVHILGGYILVVLASEEQLDEEWVELIKEALELGISIEEIRNFLNK